jgi:hydroxylamine reductase
MLDNTMFCYQCEQTSHGAGCTALGVCGKDSTVSALQDLLVYQLEGIAFYGNAILAGGGALRTEVDHFLLDALFSTLTNVNFDPARFLAYLKESRQVKIALRAQAGALAAGSIPAAATFLLPEDDTAIQSAAYAVDIRPDAERSPDLQSLKDTLLYGAKGMAAYAHHAWVLGARDAAVNAFLYKALAALVQDDSIADGSPVAPSERIPAALGLVLELGQVNLKCMEMLDRANTTAFGHPEPTRVPVTVKRGPFIVVSGHDLADLGQLLEQTAGKGINVYTHGEMLPANSYPGLKKYPHLRGNYGGAWQVQQREFGDLDASALAGGPGQTGAGLPGAILMTTNCILEPRPSYADRIFTTGAVGWPNVPHISARIGGKDFSKDFSPVIERALALGGWPADEPEQTIVAGFGHNALLSNAGAIVEAVKTGQIKHFFLIGGCDGAKAGRNYYTQFAELTPPDSIMLTLACGKYRFNKQDFGTVADFPRLLDVGQCNDAYSAIRVAAALAEAFNCGLNDLPLSMVVSWFEQKAVCILLTLLSLGVKNIYLGPTLPAFLSPNVLKLLVEQYDLHPISTPEADLAAMLN